MNDRVDGESKHLSRCTSIYQRMSMRGKYNESDK